MEEQVCGNILEAVIAPLPFDWLLGRSNGQDENLPIFGVDAKINADRRDDDDANRSDSLFAN